MVSPQNKQLARILIADAVIFLFFIAGVQQIRLKAFLFPITAGTIEHLRLQEADDSVTQLGLHVGDSIVSIDGFTVSSNDDIEFICDGLEIGDIVSVNIIRNGVIQQRFIPLAACYGSRYVVVILLVGALFFFLGIFVLVKRPTDRAAQVYHWISISVGGIIMMTWGRYSIEPYEIGYLLRALFTASYVYTGALFFHFSLVFPQPKETIGLKSGFIFRWLETDKMKRLLRARNVFYAVATVLTLWLGVQFFLATNPVTIEGFHRFNFYFSICRYFFIATIGLGTINMVHFYRNAIDQAERQKYRWTLVGSIVGAHGYMIAWMIPNLIGIKPLFAEDFVIILSAIAPISFAISILKYHVMDIDLLIKRSTVYAIVLIVLITMYIVIVALAGELIGATIASMPLGIQTAAAVAIALLFDPVRKRVQRFVDKKFFRVQYNFLETQRHFIHDIKQSYDLIHLAELIVDKTDALLNVERIGFFYVRETDHQLRVLAHRGFEMLARHSIRLRMEELQLSLQMPIALEKHMEAGIAYEPINVRMLHRWGLAIIFPMLSETQQILGFLVLGEKKSGARFNQEDVDLLNTVTTQAGLAIERINLQLKYLLERAETERLKELNRLKSYFVSSVSHELKTPLTSIRMFAELLQSTKSIPRETMVEYLQIIEGESDRLASLINNVLNFAKVERGVKEYHFTEVNIHRIVEQVVRTMQYQLKMHACSIGTSLDAENSIIVADEIAVGEACMNLISNAMKYSTDTREIAVRTHNADGSLRISVEDHGIGISEKDQKELFTPFFRAHNSETQQVGGTGLGLSLVKHIMDAHHGEVLVQSQLGEGSTFTLVFPTLLQVSPTELTKQ